MRNLASAFLVLCLAFLPAWLAPAAEPPKKEEPKKEEPKKAEPKKEEPSLDEPPLETEPPLDPVKTPPKTVTPVEPEPDQTSQDPRQDMRKFETLGADGKIVPPPGMIEIPEGSFQMGATDQSGDQDTRDVLFTPAERPVRWVPQKSFFIMKHEVTNQEYWLFIDATRSREPFHWNQYQGRYKPGTGRHPVVGVSFKDAEEYAKWLTVRERRVYRLPFEAEWEKASRGGTDGRLWPWGSLFDPSKCNTAERYAGPAKTGEIRTTPVGSFPAGVSPYGVFDMAGNVWEWTQSWYDKYPDATAIDKDFGKKFRIVRGGSWLWTKDRALCSRRKKERELTTALDLGFRLVADVLPAKPAKP